ncbi:uncharacterized protein E0L32_001057 [Thyridium curvatum]|uniref:non-specific serine/threonine protein kinase n=1 Tax=Thyridium curvatum TaxID=1093900 RepID=A0A507B1S3_9PEZI|nr:uncharacterized protein E0L32_001057 [Thyridium curvatum]TPX11239.1 hypothetical protein E0L32_001057 [Thyridium curvatum]
MLKSNQEGHLRAERDFLVASEGSRWIVPLIASFQDAANLYLVMEYMPGGDFLGLLIRENILHETVARFYIAEMIVCVEEAHALRCIHRDIKPDNFLVSASGHLKISDFGLAFDGHWSHDTTYYTSTRYSLLKKLGINVDGDEQDRKSGKARHAATTIAGLEKHEPKNGYDVGTSQYMAPEWSIGVILYECLYGHTPFLAEEGRHQTKQNIITERLCSQRYRLRDIAALASSAPSPAGYSSHQRPTDFADRYVYPYDAEDIKSHKWFRGVPWDRLHLLPPPFIPSLRSTDDTQYFEEDDPISDRMDSSSESSEASAEPDDNLTAEQLELREQQRELKRVNRENEMRDALRGFGRSIQRLALGWVAAPYDATRLRNVDQCIDQLLGVGDLDKEVLKQFVRCFGRKERKRPRDRLLRDKGTKGIVLDLRKRHAFLGYTWRRRRASPTLPATSAPRGGLEQLGFGPTSELASLRALHGARMGV